MIGQKSRVLDKNCVPRKKNFRGREQERTDWRGMGMRVSSEKSTRKIRADGYYYLFSTTTFRAKPKLTLDEAADLSVDTQRSLERRKRTNLCAFVCMRERQARPRGLIRCELIHTVSLPLRIVHMCGRG